MALKGMTKIELTNVKTGEVETVEKHNLVTNALKYALSNPFGWQTLSSGSNTLAGNIIPICPNLVGGILLYESAIPEDVNQLYAQPGNVLVGYSGNSVNDTEDQMRGSINLNESGPLETGDGYRFVFDFSTSQGNGTIGSVGLTSKWGGDSGPGSYYLNKKSNIDYRYNPNINIYALAGNAYYDVNSSLDFSVTYDEENCIVTSVYLSSAGVITIDRIWIPAAKWRLSENIDPFLNYKKVGTSQISTNSFGKKTYTASDLLKYYGRFCDGQDGYIWGFELPNGENKEGKATIGWIKINIDTLEFEEGTWEVDAQLKHFGSQYVPIHVIIGNNRYSAKYNWCAVNGGYLYCFQYDMKRIVKIDMKNITNIIFIDLDEDTVNQLNNDLVPNMIVQGNVVHAVGGYINGDKFIRYRISSTGDYTRYRDYSTFSSRLHNGLVCTSRYLPGGHFHFGVYELFYEYQEIPNFTFTLIGNYLATINNLPAPVEKTADKTMKITYIIREEVET